jgi:hypothetical protein
MGLSLSTLSISSCTASSPASTQQIPGSHVSTTTETPIVASSSASVATVKNPWSPGEFQNGVQLYWHLVGSDVDIQHAADRSLDYIVSLGANSVGITFPIYTDGAEPSRVYAEKGETPTPHQLAIVIQAAKQRKLRVMLRPIIDETNIMSTPGAWRGTLHPINSDSWFASYESLLITYAIVATQEHVDEFVAGTELFSLQNQTDKWSGIVSALRKVSFTGAISYSVNWDSKNADSLPFDTLGLDAYPAITLNDDATPEELTQALTDWILTQPASVLKKLTIQEVGIPAISGMYHNPWLWGGNGPQNLVIQANWFTAMYKAAKNANLMGIYYWMIDSNVDPSLANVINDPSGSFIKRPAEKSIRTSFSP